MRIDADSSSRTAIDYVARVNRAIDYIVANVDQPLKLSDVARVACFSSFHFHRVFRSILGETLNQFVLRIRLERALRMLSHEPKSTLTRVALACGFASSSDFSRSFKRRYGVAPSAFAVEEFRQHRRQEWQAAVEQPSGTHRLHRLPPGRNPDGFVAHLGTLPPRRVAYVRVLDPFRPHVVVEAASRLIGWAREREIADAQWLGYMWDDPEIVAHRDCRYDVAVEAPDAKPDGEVGVLELPAMRVAQVEIRGPIDLELRALDWLFKTWLPSSDYVPARQPCFESWIGLPFANGTEYFELSVQVPVERG